MKKGRPSYNEENVNFIKEVFGDRPIIVELQEEDMMFLFYEMIDCYLSGYYLASFMLSHAFIENSLLSYYQSKTGTSKIVFRYVDILNKSLEEDLISEEIHNKLNLFRRIRNRYAHPGVHPDYSLQYRMYHRQGDESELFREDADEILKLIATIFSSPPFDFVESSI